MLWRHWHMVGGQAEPQQAAKHAHFAGQFKLKTPWSCTQTKKSWCKQLTLNAGGCHIMFCDRTAELNWNRGCSNLWKWVQEDYTVHMLEAAKGYFNKSTLCAFDMYSLTCFSICLGVPLHHEDPGNWEQELDLLLCKHQSPLIDCLTQKGDDSNKLDSCCTTFFRLNFQVWFN